MSCAVSGPDVSSLSLPKGLGTSPPPYGGGDEEEEELPASTPRSGSGDLRLVGDLATAEVGRPKQFSIDIPASDRQTECNVVVTGNKNIAR